MPERVISLKFPVGGQSRFVGIQSKHPFFTEQALNVRPFDTIDERLRGGNRPGLSKYKFWEGSIPRPVSGIPRSENPVNLLTCINVAGGETSTPTRFVDDFRDGVDPSWELLGVQATQGVGLNLIPGTSVGGRAQRVRPANLDLDSEYLVRTLIVSVLDELSGNRVIRGRVLLGIGVQDPSDTRSFEHLEVELKGAYRGVEGVGQSLELSLLHFNRSNEVRRNLVYSVGEAQNRFLPFVTLEVRVFPGNSPTVIVSLGEVDAPFAFAMLAPVEIPAVRGTNLSVFLGEGLQSDDSPRVHWYSLDYSVLDAAIFPEPGCLLVAAADHRLKIRTADGAFSVPETGLLHQATRPLMATDFIGPPKLERSAGIFLFIADHGKDDDGEEVAPKYYDPRDNELRTWATDLYEAGDDPPPEEGELDEGKGEVPRGNFIMARFKGRIYLAGEPAHAWYASRIGDPFDWDFGKNILEAGDDPGAAVFSQSAELSDIGEPLRALVPSSDDYLLFGTSNQTYRMGGDPGFGGRPRLISSQVGFAGPTSWCPTPEGETIILDPERGLFLLGAGGASYPVPLSANVLPKELRDIDPRDVVAHLAYDHRQPGVHIILKSAQQRTLTNFWYDRRTDRLTPSDGLNIPSGFWPFTLEQAHMPLTILSYQSTDPDLSGVLLGCEDGFIRRFDQVEPEDDGTSFASNVLYGPFKIAGRDHLEGVLNWLRSEMATTRFFPKFEVFTATTASKALAEQNGRRLVFSGVFNEDPIVHVPVLLRGVIAYIRISGRRSAWYVESLDVAVEPMGAPRA